MPNIVYVGASLDGYIADRDGNLDFLQSVPNPDNLDFGFQAFMDSIDAVVMGRTTFETVLGFGVEWPYSKPVFVLSTALKDVPDGYTDKVRIMKGSPGEIVKSLYEEGYHRLYIDGGKVIRSFLEQDMIDELIVSTIPVLVGGGTSLFGALPDHLEFELVGTEVFLKAIVKAHYRRKR